MSTVAAYLNSPNLQLANRLRTVFPPVQDSEMIWRQTATPALAEEIIRRRTEAESETPYLGSEDRDLADHVHEYQHERDLVDRVHEYRNVVVDSLLARGEEITCRKVTSRPLPDMYDRIAGPTYAGWSAYEVAAIEDIPADLLAVIGGCAVIDVEEENDKRPTWYGVAKDGNGRKAIRTAELDLLLDDDVWLAREGRLSAPNSGWQVNLMDGGTAVDARATALLEQHGEGPYVTARNIRDRTGETTARHPDLVRRWLERYGHAPIDELVLGLRKGWQHHAHRREIRDQKLIPAVLRIVREDRATRPEIAKVLGCHHDTIYQIAPLPKKAVTVRRLPDVDAAECGYVRTIKGRALAYAKFGLSAAAEWEGRPGGWRGTTGRRGRPGPKTWDLQEDDIVW